MTAPQTSNTPWKKYGAIALAVLVGAGIASFILSVTENVVTRKLGGTMTINLPAGQRFINATWKDSDNSLWVISRPGDSTPTTYTMTQHSVFGILEGKVIIREK